jgi:hypothetical protein
MTGAEFRPRVLRPTQSRHGVGGPLRRWKTGNGWSATRRAAGDAAARRDVARSSGRRTAPAGPALLATQFPVLLLPPL